jgi:hypothetical protein
MWIYTSTPIRLHGVVLKAQGQLYLFVPLLKKVKDSQKYVHCSTGLRNNYSKRLGWNCGEKFQIFITFQSLGNEVWRWVIHVVWLHVPLHSHSFWFVAVPNEEGVNKSHCPSLSNCTNHPVLELNLSVNLCARGYLIYVTKFLPILT